MSGGYYTYAYFKIRELAENIQEDLEKEKKEDEDNNLSEEVKAGMSKLILELDDVADKVKALEWFMSGDTGEEDFLREMNPDRPLISCRS